MKREGGERRVRGRRREKDEEEVKQRMQNKFTMERADRSPSDSKSITSSMWILPVSMGVARSKAFLGQMTLMIEGTNGFVHLQNGAFP